MTADCSEVRAIRNANSSSKYCCGAQQGGNIQLWTKTFNVFGAETQGVQPFRCPLIDIAVSAFSGDIWICPSVFTGKARAMRMPADKVTFDASSQDGDDLAAELAFLFKRAGHDVPADRMSGILAGYAELKVMLALLRQPRTAAHEPANIYSLETITRGE